MFLAAWQDGAAYGGKGRGGFFGRHKKILRSGMRCRRRRIRLTVSANCSGP
jgi:hypothetical protein